MSERYPARALCDALKGHIVIDASCDGEGSDDVRLKLDNGSVILIDSAPDLQYFLGQDHLRSKLVVKIGGKELWPFEEGEE